MSGKSREECLPYFAKVLLEKGTVRIVKVLTRKGLNQLRVSEHQLVSFSSWKCVTVC